MTIALPEQPGEYHIDNMAAVVRADPSVPNGGIRTWAADIDDCEDIAWADARGRADAWEARA